MQKDYDGLRSFLAECEKLGEVKVIKDADWNLEIGALTETVSEMIDEPPALMFDEIKGYPKGFRVLGIPTASRVRMAIALALPPDTPRMEIVRHNPFLVVVSIKQQYAGHAKQAGMAVLSSAASARNGRFVVIVDEDIDPSNMKEVIWAMTTRADPKTDIEIVEDCWATPLDPRMPPEQTANGPFTNSRAIVYAVRPWSWKDKFPPVNRIDKEQRDAILTKYGDTFAFPRR